MEPRPRLLVFYATQTGNSQDVAERIGREADRQHLSSLVIAMDKFDPGNLESEELAVFIVSTTGQGDQPDMMKNFWKFLLKRSLSAKWLKGLKFAVFGLGDSGYQQYNVVAKKLDRRLGDLGGIRIIDKGLGDDQHPSGYEASLDPWLLTFWTSIAIMSGRTLDLSPLSYNKLVLDKPKYNVMVCKTPSEVSPAKNWQFEEANRARRLLDTVDSVHEFDVADSFYEIGPRNPHLAHMVCNRRLTKESSDRDVRHIELELGGSGLTYKPGDVLAVMPSQSDAVVDAFISRCSLDPDALVLVQPAHTPHNSWKRGFNFNNPVTVRVLVQSVMDVASASPRRYFFEVMSHFASAQHEKERLIYFVSSEGRDDLYQYNQRERRTVLEVLEDFPSVQLPLEWLLQLVPRLQPRFFSISSSLLVHPNQVHITVAVQKWKTPLNRTRHGLCSTWLSHLDPQKGEIYVPIWIKQGLKFPDPSVPLLLVGPGTGCAPFRALIEEYVFISASDKVAPIMFFFGCRQEQDDFLYKDLWFAQSGNFGVLSEAKGGGFFVAFSRDQPKKVYVQHKIDEQSGKVWAMLHSKRCAVYVAGSAVKMPEDVFAAFEKVVMKETSQSEEAARKWMKQLERVGRYHVEAW